MRPTELGVGKYIKKGVVMRDVMKDIICDKIQELKSICLNNKYSDSLCNDVSALLSEVIDRLNWLTFGERMNGVYITEKQYE